MKADSPSPFEALFRSLRGRINGPIVQGRPVQLPSWEISAALDVLEDTHLALQSFLRAETPSDLGLKYLWVYGALQALYVQQDAFIEIARAFEIPFEIKNLPPEILKIREDRNNIVGHPISRINGPQEVRSASHFLVQSELDVHFVKVMRVSPNLDAPEYLRVDLGKLVSTQEQALAQKLSHWLNEESAH